MKTYIYHHIYNSLLMSAIPKSSHFASLGPTKCILKYKSQKIHKKLQRVPQIVILGTPICLQFGHDFALGRPPGPLDSLCGPAGCPQTPKSHQNRAPDPSKMSLFCRFSAKKYVLDMQEVPSRYASRSCQSCKSCQSPVH